MFEFQHLTKTQIINEILFLDGKYFDIVNLLYTKYTKDQLINILYGLSHKRMEAAEMIKPNNTTDDTVFVVDLDEQMRWNKYVIHLDKILDEIRDLVKAGYEMIWSENQHWCTINGRVYNIHKDLWEKRNRQVTAPTK